MGSEKSNEVIANMFLENLRKDGKDRYRSVIVNIVFIPLFVNRSDTSQFELSWTDTKQLLDDVEHDIMNYQNRGLCFLPKPKAEADNTDTRFR